MVKNISQKKAIACNSSVTNAVRKKGLKCHFFDIREAHGTLKTKHLKENEIDFLHGRVTTNVFMRKYFNPPLISDFENENLQGYTRNGGKKVLSLTASTLQSYVAIKKKQVDADKASGRRLGVGPYSLGSKV